VDVALQESGQVQAIAARRLGVNPSLINQALSGKVYSQFRGKKKAPEQK
jgi:DNA-binding transcriptional regulator YdaS (Cro superfamily)